ncbi:MAG: right-handed parallel beta-helix repeat-containing protein [Verrucomicrobia bacterium]|nr:right-handed parallel beta-helix repeat-containing protein [Verrucomicrobiota bacterium]
MSLWLTICTVASAAELRMPGAFPTLQAAVDAAQPGDVVLVRAGTYRERVRLKDRVTLRSAGDDTPGKLGLARAEATVIDGAGKAETAPGVAMAEGSVLDGFTVTGVGRYDDAEWQRHFATRGNEQAHEHIGAPGVAGVSIQGVNCEVRGNIVHHVGYTGIAITGVDGRANSPLVVSNVCFRNMGGGIGSMRGSTATLRGNTCFENFYAGIGHENASPLVELNRCFGNIRAGIGISEGACPTVRSNLCYENRRAGIGIRTGANTRPIVERNDCRANGMAGIGVEEEAEPVLRFNRCFDNLLAGIGARDHARPAILNNECFKNGEAGIGLMTGRETQVSSNYCHLNKTAGVGLSGGGANSVVLTGNRLIQNGTVAVGINGGWTVTLRGNELSRTNDMPPLVMVAEGATAVFTNNTLRGGGVAAIRVSGNIRVINSRIEGTTVRRGGPPNFGVWALPGAKVEMIGNTVSGWRHAFQGEGATLVAHNNAVADAVTAAFRIRGRSGKSVVSRNRVSRNDVKELLVEPDGK